MGKHKVTLPRPGRLLEVQCGRCRHVHRVTADEVVRGRWRNCPKCNAACDTEQADDDHEAA